MRWACAPAINPIGIAQLVDEITMPGEVQHLLCDCFADSLVSPTGGEIGKANVLLWSCPQELIAIGESCLARPMGGHTLSINNTQVRHGIAQLRQHVSFRRDGNSLWASSQHQQRRCRLRL